MTQLDVPTISLTHYLDLLRRRTWHVIIVSVLGLVIGGVVALLIPRYYVAVTMIQFNRPVLDSKLGSPEDPMAQVVNAAKITVPRGAQEAIKRLDWQEGTTGTREAQRGFTTSVRRRIYVTDMGPRGRGRSIAQLSIQYHDTSGDRAAEMANELRKIWLKSVVDELELQANKDYQAVVAEIEKVVTEKVRVAKQLALYEEENGINPEDHELPNRTSGALSALSAEIRELGGEVDALDAAILLLDAKIGFRKTDLEEMSPTLPVPANERFANPALKAEYQKVTLQMLALVKTLDMMTQSHPDYEQTKRNLASIQSRAVQLEQAAGGQAAPKPNPLYTAVEDELRSLSTELTVKKKTLAERRDRLAKRMAQRKRLPGIYLTYNELRAKLASFRKREEVLNADLEEKNKVMRLIRLERPVELLQEAYVPSRPTEPNPYLLALIGCAVGLGIAVALVILIDFMQMTFKSVAEVESGLGLPVLGSMSHMDTDAEVMVSRDRRARMTILGVAFLVLLLTVITIFYVSPTSLPDIVRDFLDFLLNEPTR